MKSPRMERVLALLRERGARGATGIEISDVCAVVSPRDYVRRLRDHGNEIETLEEGTTRTGGRIVRYVWKSGPAHPCSDCPRPPKEAQGDLFTRTG